VEISWRRLAVDGRVEPHKPSRRELAELRRTIRRNLQDASLSGLSDDNRFGIAYEAALMAAKMAIACAGYRIRGEGSHETSFIALEIALGPSAAQIGRYFQQCRRTRNEISYTRAGVVDSNDVREIIEQTRLLQELVEAWIANRHPHLA
jgi:hypothetical protein